MTADPRGRALLWRLVGRHVFRLTPHNAFRFRRMVLGLFGATTTPATKIRRSAVIDRPWNLTVGARSMIGDDTVIRAVEPITIGDRCTISQLGVLLTEVRGIDGLRRGPIVMEDDSWVATDALVLPGSRIGEGTVIGARSTAEGDYPTWCLAVGDPAVPRAPRVIR